MELTNILVALIVATPATLAWISSRKNTEKIKSVEAKVEEKSDSLHELMNGKVAEMVALARKGTLAEGRAAGVEQERARKPSKKTTPKNA